MGLQLNYCAINMTKQNQTAKLRTSEIQRGSSVKLYDKNAFSVASNPHFMYICSVSCI